MVNRVLFLFLFFLFNCQSPFNSSNPGIFSSVQIDTIFSASDLNVRALEVMGNKAIAVSSAGDLFHISLPSYHVQQERITTDSLNFRASALTKKGVFALSIGSPAHLYKNGQLVFYDSHPNAFYDAIHFWNSEEGIALGDPTEECLTLLITRDGGDSWNKLDCNLLPKFNNGEAAFAASDTNISIIGDHTWIATGGASSRVLYSSDRGISWQIFSTPIVQGQSTTGIFSINFYDKKNGFAIGGDYTNPSSNYKNKIISTDGGRQWKLVSNNKGPGYRSCVQYVPNSNAKSLVAVGKKGIDYSADSGNSWRSMSTHGFYTLRFMNDTTAIAAGIGRIAVLKFKKEK